MAKIHRTPNVRSLIHSQRQTIETQYQIIRSQQNEIYDLNIKKRASESKIILYWQTISRLMRRSLIQRIINRPININTK